MLSNYPLFVKDVLDVEYFWKLINIYFILLNFFLRITVCICFLEFKSI